MNSKLLACWAIMRGDMRTGSHRWEEAVMVISRNTVLQYLNSFRNLRAIFRERYVMQVQIKHIPITSICSKTSNFILRNIFVSVSWTSIRLKTFLAAEGQQFLLYGFEVRFKLCDPWDLLSFPPSFEWQARDQIWTSQLPRVVFVLWRKLLAVDSHE